MWERGTRVECVNADPQHGRRWGKNEAPIQGARYTVERCLEDASEPGTWIVHLQELSRCSSARRLYGEDAGYAAERFRPLSSQGMSILRKLLEPSPDETEKVLAEDAVATVNEATRLIRETIR